MVAMPPILRGRPLASGPRSSAAKPRPNTSASSTASVTSAHSTASRRPWRRPIQPDSSAGTSRQPARRQRGGGGELPQVAARAVEQRQQRARASRGERERGRAARAAAAPAPSRRASCARRSRLRDSSRPSASSTALRSGSTPSGSSRRRGFPSQTRRGRGRSRWRRRACRRRCRRRSGCRWRRRRARRSGPTGGRATLSQPVGGGGGDDDADGEREADVQAGDGGELVVEGRRQARVHREAGLAGDRVDHPDVGQPRRGDREERRRPGSTAARWRAPCCAAGQ